MVLKVVDPLPRYLHCVHYGFDAATNTMEQLVIRARIDRSIRYRAETEYNVRSFIHED